jgi:6-phosphogluconolactonase
LNNVRVFSDLDSLAEKIALRLKEEADLALEENRIYSIVLSGGESAAKIYQKFSSPELVEKIPWRAVHLFWADERCVPSESKECNFNIACEAFLNSISIPSKNIHRINAEINPHKESIRYDMEIREHLTLKETDDFFFDWVLLGLGEDGHTASLFPNQENLFKTTNLCILTNNPKTGQKRITLTPAAIKKSSCVTYHVVGQHKSQIVASLFSEFSQSLKYPASYIPGEWYLDKDAASNLRKLKKN